MYEHLHTIHKNSLSEKKYIKVQFSIDCMGAISYD